LPHFYFHFSQFIAEMAEVEVAAVQPLVVVYDAVTGVPSEYNEFLPKDCEEYKKWKAVQSGENLEGQMANLGVAGNAAAGTAAAPAAEAAEKSSGGGSKKKNKGAPMVVLEKNVRNKKKCITTISGLDMFGVKLNEAAKMFGKKFASGASVNKTPDGKEQIDCQGDFLDQAAELILKQYKDSVKREDVYFIENKKKERYFTDE
jgi:density-regulated protein